MFSAFVFACATSVSLGVDMDSCLRYNDSWGPYKTEANCIIRSKQMRKEITEGVLKEYVFLDLGSPSGIIVQGFCEKVIEA